MKARGFKAADKRSELKTLVVGTLEVNCYVLWDTQTRDAFVIDPGADGRKIKKIIEDNQLSVRHIVNTHGHFDHVGADGELKGITGAPINIHREDAEMLGEAHEHGVIFGVITPPQPAPDKLLDDGVVLKAGGLTLRVLHTPGHTAGGICLYEEAEGLLFTGDTLFAGSIGRTDLGGGSFPVIIASIKNKLLPLGGEVVVLPGHGPDSTIGIERKTNQFLG
ncbi:MAG: MBL fold metallo-hydrolase [Deltaproteobacteria bacterium]|nr:MBL fold metallo-hydrolase [Deltaproteobacteria bacterium]